MIKRQSSLDPQVMRAARQKFGHFSSFMVHDDALYQEIASVLTSPGRQPSSPTFLELFDAEVSRITDYVIGQYEYQERSAKSLLANSFTLTDGNAATSDEQLQGLRHMANCQLEACLKLRRFTKNSADTLSQVAEYADSNLGTSCSALWQHQRRRFPSADSALIVVFSDIYATLHSGETKQNSSDENWVAPSSFERTTIKYWVNEDNLAEVMLLASAEAPLLVYGRNGRLTTKADCLLRQSLGDTLWGSLVTPISSVYFDSPNMDLYKSRIVRAEGSQLLRARWYGAMPKGTEPIFLELKTHHEKWINSKSVKERATIQAQDMKAFLSQKKWTDKDALELLIPANPNLGGEGLEKATNLLMTMHSLVIKLGLRACVRSVYKRAAFQSAQSNSLRLTVDRGVALIDEQARPRVGAWCLPDDDAAIEPHMVKHVPYAIFEVKLSSSEMPDAIRTMEEDETIVLAAKFSKFLTGAASCNVDKIDKLPYWADHPAFASLFKPSKTLPVVIPKIAYGSSLMSTTCSTSDTKSSKRDDRTMPIGDEITATYSVDSCRSRRGFRNLLRENSSATVSTTHIVVPKKSVRVEPKSFFANERTFIQWVSGALLLVTVSAIILDFQSHRNGSLTVGFCLISCGAVIVCYAIFVYFRRLKLLTSGSPYGYVDRVGPVVLASSVLVGIVVLLVYYYDVTGFGTTAKVELSIHPDGLLCTQHSLQGVSLLEYQPSDVIVDSERSLLLIPSLSQITGVSTKFGTTEPLQTFADIPDTDLECLTYVKNRLFAVSEGSMSSTLIELKWDAETLVEVQDFKVPTANVEGIVFVQDRGNETDGRLFVAGNNFLVETGTTVGVIDVYRVPTPFLEDTERKNELTPTRLNNNLLNQGLKDSKISALYYFEEVLYILHDNAQIVRAWNIDEGKLLSEWKLPNVAGVGFDKQWEGLAVERRGEVQISAESDGVPVDLSLPASLLLHLSLDSPPAVWTIMVKQNATSGALILPACAAATP